MAEKANKYPENAPGKYYVDNQCIDCDLCRQTAPNNYGHNEQKGYSFVSKQASNADEQKAMAESKDACPVSAIGDDGA
jgi:ferredoxin